LRYAWVRLWGDAQRSRQIAKASSESSRRTQEGPGNVHAMDVNKKQRNYRTALNRLSSEWRLCLQMAASIRIAKGFANRWKSTVTFTNQIDSPMTALSSQTMNAQARQLAGLSNHILNFVQVVSMSLECQQAGRVQSSPLNQE
jgi:hypothetical protein